jgi:hypothetical protein
MGNMWRTLSELVRRYDPRKRPVADRSSAAGQRRWPRSTVSPEPEYVSACHLCYRIRECLSSASRMSSAPPRCTAGLPLRPRETLGGG